MRFGVDAAVIQAVMKLSSIQIALASCALSSRPSAAADCATGLHAHRGHLGTGDVRARMRFKIDAVGVLVVMMLWAITSAVIAIASSSRVSTAASRATGLHAHLGRHGAGDVRARMRSSVASMGMLMVM